MQFLERHKGWLSAVITVLIWTFFIIIARASASHTLLPLDIAFLRIVGASCVLLPLGLWLSRHQPHTGSLGGLSPLPLRVTLLAGLFGSTLYAMLAYAGFFFAPAAHASVLMPGSLPLWTSLLAWWLLKDRLSPARLMGLGLILGGDLLVGGASLWHAFDGGDMWKGDVLFVSAAMCWAVYSVLVRHHGLNAIEATIGITAFSCVFFLPSYAVAVLLGWVPSHLQSAPWQEMLFQAVYQGIGSVAISGITFNVMIRCYGPVRSTMMTALVPGLSALGAVALLDEPMSWNLMAGLACVTLGILAGSWVKPASHKP
jgi:drug/metabolite transporter (DMT)-like permease